MKINSSIPEAIKKAKKIGIGCHTFPDGDALGSVMAMTLALRKTGREAYMFMRDSVPDNLKFLPLSEEAENSTPEVREGTDLILMLDCGALDRVNVDLKGIYGTELINIDHHKTNDRYGDLNLVLSKASATGEIIFFLLRELGIETDEEIATCLYTAITADTGSFRYQCTTDVTHKVAAELLRTGIPFPEISRTVFDTKPFGKIQLTARVLQTMEQHFNGKVSLMTVREKDFQDFDLKGRDTSDIVNYGLLPSESDVSIILKESEGKIRVSMRTKNQVDAGKFSEKFLGGGHARAAGMTFLTPSFSEVRDTLLKELEAWLY